MAASLVKSFAGLCIQARNVVALTNGVYNLKKNVIFSSSMRQFSAIQIKSTEQKSLSKCRLHTSPMSMTTPELKEWREQRVIDRFYRLPWGAWIRTQGGRKKGLYKRRPRIRWKLQQHIFCNYHQNKLLDKLVTPKWKEPKYFVDSPYEPYSQRTNSFWHPNHRKFYP
ncbi:39S ribosomal protein l35, mitochondrial [Plakobranchus ocellatus]|uniref:Large ribosomal subunit protein bL35m n=1 Tax=Plakobranchus ocellatus TaxID=259542 RepID=A0AAV4DKW5_9GAST|nr:39S ribosomal protein l35, mitochondrial [Plakobranchus ocellatus]